MDDLNALQNKVAQLESELTEARKRASELENSKNGTSSEVNELPTTINEFEETLRRLVQRTAMIVQAEKCVIMVRDRDSGDLIARSPAFGMTEEEVQRYRCPINGGISGEVFRSGHAAIFPHTDQDARTVQENLVSLRVKNGVTVPLVIERRDEENRVQDRNVIGVLHCFNKRYGAEFIDEDVRLLERLSRNAASVIANAQMFQEVFEEKQKLAHTLESLTAGLIFINQHGRIGQMNAQARVMFAVPSTVDPHGKPVEEIIQHEECLTIIRNKIHLAEETELVEGEAIETDGFDEINVEDEDGIGYIYQVHAAEVHDDTDREIGTVVIFNDITEIRNLERMKTEFVSIVSHELRTPLTPMKGFIRTLLDDENEEWYTAEDRREFYGIIEQNVDRLKRLIDDLLNVSRIEKGKGIDINWEDVDIRDATESVLKVQRGRTDKHNFVLDFEPETIIAETDPDIFQNILQNLVSNAIKYAPDGGEVRIIGRIEPANEERPESLLVGVKDEGIGIPEAWLKKLGEKFARVDSKDSQKAGGTGIGLYLVKNLIKAHNGLMWPESEGAGKGSTFWMRFPIHQPRPTPVEGAPTTPDAG